MSSFTITAASQKVALDASGVAQVPFTVTNTSTEMVRGRLLTKPHDPAKPEWLSLLGESVRDFTPSAAVQVIVRLTVPSGSPAGSYSFRLDALSETNPDDSTEGPSVAFDVAASKPKKHFRRWRRSRPRR